MIFYLVKSDSFWKTKKEANKRKNYLNKLMKKDNINYTYEIEEIYISSIT